MLGHPYLQRMSRIRQLGLTYLVYPGALHTRFHHALGALHLMMQSIEVIRAKGHTITDEEAQAVCIAILLHDLGHGPFSHALEKEIIEGVNHEAVSAILMNELNLQYDGQLTLAINIFKGSYHKKFLHQLVSSQLDMDRLDYLNRDSFFTGVSEGVISSERIIKVLNVKNDELVIEAKGIYSVEKFIIARRLMYWQVYLHKTVLSAEFMLIRIMQRARQLIRDKKQVFITPTLKTFLENRFTPDEFRTNKKLVSSFALIDDSDVLSIVKEGMTNDDKIFSMLCRGLMNRVLYKVLIEKEPVKTEKLKAFEQKAASVFNARDDDMKFYVFTDSLINNAYSSIDSGINIIFKDGTMMDLAAASDNLNISVLSEPVTKYFLWYNRQLI